MSRQIEAVYEGGVFRPLTPVELPERQRVRLTVEASADAAEQELAAWGEVYAGLSDDDVAELDRIVKDRSRFMPPPRG